MRLWIILPIVALAASACGSHSPTGPSQTGSSTGSSSTGGSGTPTSSLTATIDGAAFTGTNVTATYHAGTDISTLLVNALDTGQNLLSFDIGTERRVAFAPGTFTLGSDGSNATYNPFLTTGNTGFNALNGPQTGSVIVTAFSATAKTASGTFSFVLHNASASKTVTNGAFSVTFP